MRRLTNTIDRTVEYNEFIDNLNQFHLDKGTTLHAEPILGKRRVDLLKLYKIVTKQGGFESVTQSRSWKQIGNEFGFPSTCTNSAYILKGLYIRNLLGFEEEKVHGRIWKPPEELKGPNAHKITTLAGNKYRKHVPRSLYTSKHKSKKQRLDPIVNMLEPFQDHTNISHFSPNNDNSNISSPISFVNTPNEHQLSTSFMFNNNTIVPEETKQKLLFSLRFGDEKNINWALDFLLDLTFQSTESFPILSSPILLELLLDHSKPYLEYQNNENKTNNNQLKNKNTNNKGNQDKKNKEKTSKDITSDPLEKDALSSIMNLVDEVDESATLNFEWIKKVMYIIRNYSTKEADAMLISNHTLLKNTIIKTLNTCIMNGNLALGRCCIDIVDNMAAHIPLNGPDDEWIPCINKLILVQDRYFMVTSIKILTKIGTCDLNQLFLTNNQELVSCIAHQLLSEDEEVVGVTMEYLYQQISLSTECRQQLISSYNGAYIGIFVNKLLYRTKYYMNKVVKDDLITDVTTPGLSLQPSSPSSSTTNSDNSSNNSGGGTQSSASSVYGSISTPTSSSSLSLSSDPFYSSIPDITNYETLEEPYRCLGWLKDKFEVTEPNHTLSLDDMYLLYYSRFGTEKTLKLEQFYSVLKIAFPEQPPQYIMEKGKIVLNPSKNGTTVKGLCVYGLQIKMNLIILDELNTNNTTCQWNNCSGVYDDKNSLEQHVLNTHLSNDQDSLKCEWNQCTCLFESKENMKEHLQQHLLESMTITTNAIDNNDNDQNETNDINSNNDNNKNNDMDNNINGRSEDEQIVELKGISLIAAHLLRFLSEEPNSATYFSPIEIDLVNIATNNPSLSSFVYTILSNVRIHSVTNTNNTIDTPTTTNTTTTTTTPTL